MEAKDIRELTLEELKARESNLHQEIFNLRFQFSTGQLKSPGKIRENRKDIARIKTVVQEKTESAKRSVKNNP